jgi:hypothetical protein
VVASLLAGLVNGAAAGTVTVTKPKNKVPAIEIIVLRDQLTHETFTITATIQPGTNAAGKANAIAAAAPNGHKPFNYKFGDTTLKFPGTSYVSNISASRETTKLGMGPTFADAFNPRFASLGYAVVAGNTHLAGRDDDGNASTYTAGFEIHDPAHGNVSLLADVGFAQLTSPTVAGLLTTEFNLLNAQLAAEAPALVGDLKLDLTRNLLDFSLPSTTIDASVTNGNTDVSLVTNATLSAVPEPSSLLLVTSGLVGLLVFRRLAR